MQEEDGREGLRRGARRWARRGSELMAPLRLGSDTLRECRNRAATVQKKRADLRQAKHRPQKQEKCENPEEKIEKSQFVNTWKK